MTRKPRKTREEIVDELLRTSENARRLKERIERGGGKIPVTKADSDELMRRLEERIARGYEDERRRASS